MKMIAIAFGVASVTLFGCGGPSPTPGPSPAPTPGPAPAPTEGPAPTPTEEPAPTPTEEPAPTPTEEPAPTPTEDPAPAPPAPAPVYNPTSVQDAWANHFDAFGAGDADMIMLDYDDESVVAVFNDACSDDATAYAQYTGQQEIKGFFESLFGRLASPPSNSTGTLDLPSFSGGATNPIVEPTTGLDATANVFLVWNSKGEGVEAATDTFLWKPGFKIMKQNIVTSESSECPSAAQPEQKRTERRLLASTPIDDAWANHIASFDAQDLEKIMLDYLDTSVVRVFDNNGNVYSTHTGLEEIKAMFSELFDAINAATEDDDKGVAVRLEKVEPDNKSVFLVWKSISHPKATDTFLFDDSGNIVRQNIAVTTKAATQALV